MGLSIRYFRERETDNVFAARTLSDDDGNVIVSAGPPRGIAIDEIDEQGYLDLVVLREATARETTAAFEAEFAANVAKLKELFDRA